MFAEFYIAHYKNVDNGDTLDYKFHVVDETWEYCDEQAQYHAEWILEEFPSSGFCLEYVTRRDNVELGEKIKLIIQDMELIAKRVEQNGYNLYEMHQLTRCKNALDRLIHLMEE